MTGRVSAKAYCSTYSPKRDAAPSGSSPNSTCGSYGRSRRRFSQGHLGWTATASTRSNFPAAAATTASGSTRRLALRSTCARHTAGGIPTPTKRGHRLPQGSLAEVYSTRTARSASTARSTDAPGSSASSPMRERSRGSSAPSFHRCGAERRMGRATQPLHDPGNPRRFER